MNINSNFSVSPSQEQEKSTTKESEFSDNKAITQTAPINPLKNGNEPLNNPLVAPVLNNQQAGMEMEKESAEENPSMQEEKAKENAEYEENQNKDKSGAPGTDSSDHTNTKIKRKKTGEYGSLEKGDIPLKVIGIRPVKEENDLEIMISWKARENGVKPQSSKVMRIDLLRKGFWLPLIEFYESKMKLESAPNFDSNLLPKY